jgi:signal peptidase II
VVDGYWDWILEYNTGSAFSLFSGGLGSRIFLSVVALGALAIMLHLLRGARDDQRGLVVALALMAGGAVGNLIDRIAFGKVTDFVLWHWQDSFYWPVFNVADIALVLAVPLFLYYGYRAEKEQKACEAAAESSA